MAEKKLDNNALAAFSGQMALVLQAGISAMEGLTIMRDDAESADDKAILDAILDKMAGTGQFWKALEATGRFPDYMVQMARIGEETGNLDRVMHSLDVHYTREEDIRRSTANAILYPAILTAIMLVVIIILMVRVMPVFQQVFRELGSEMTGFPLMLMNIGNAISTYYVSAIIIVAAILTVFFVSSLSSQGKQFWHKAGWHIRPIRRGYEAACACRFASVMSMSLASGLTPEESLDLAIDTNEDPEFGTQLNKVKTDVEEGGSLTESLWKNKIFTGVYAHMASLGAKAGKLDQVLSRIADLYQDEVDTRLSGRLAIVEPVLVIVLSVIVGAILISVMFPLLGIMSSL